MQVTQYKNKILLLKMIPRYRKSSNCLKPLYEANGRLSQLYQCSQRKLHVAHIFSNATAVNLTIQIIVTQAKNKIQIIKDVL